MLVKHSDNKGESENSTGGVRGKPSAAAVILGITVEYGGI